MFSLQADRALMLLCVLPGSSVSVWRACWTRRLWTHGGWRRGRCCWGACIVPFGLVLRRGLDETLRPTGTESCAARLREAYARIVVLGLILLSTATTTNYLLEYMTTYASVTLGHAGKKLPSVQPR